MIPPVDHQSIEIESFQDQRRRKILLRPVRGQKFSVFPPPRGQQESRH